MKIKFKGWLIALSAITIAVVIFSLTSLSKIAVLGEDGYAVPASNAIAQGFQKGDINKITMQEVKYDDVVYANALGYFVGEEHVAIDKAYPVYTNEGTTLRFLDDENYLVSPRVEVLPTYEGLYINNGYTYNQFLDQADPTEYILLALNNGYYINVQPASFTNKLGTKEIPVNSIVRFTEDDVRWYSFGNGGMLKYDGEESVFDSYITIGDHTYYYNDFLDALGLIRTAINKIEKNADPAPEEEEAYKMLAQIKEEELLTDSEQAEPVALETAVTVSGVEREEDEDTVVVVDSGPVIAEGTVVVEVDDDDDSSVITEKKDKGYGYDSPDSSDSSSGNTSAADGNNHEKPTVSLERLGSWVYAVTGKINIIDSKKSINGGVIVEVFSGIKGKGTTYTDSEGRTVYPAVDVNGNTIYEGDGDNVQSSLKKTEEFAVGVLRPGSTQYFQYHYTYSYTITNAQGRKETRKATVYSDITEVKLLNFGDDAIAEVRSNWKDEWASHANTFKYETFEVMDAVGYNSEAAVFTVENYKKHTTEFVDHFELILKSRKDGNEIPVTINNDYIKAASKAVISYVAEGEKLEPDTIYDYSVAAKDQYGNTLTLKIGETQTDSSEYKGTLYTRKKASVYINEIANSVGSLNLSISLGSDLGIYNSGKTPVLRVLGGESQSEIQKISGEMDGHPFVWATEKAIDISRKDHEALIKNLEPNEYYTVEVYGSYDPTPTFVPEGQERLQLTEYDSLATLKILTASATADKTVPAVSLGETKTWAYIADVEMDISDPDNILNDGVTVTLYSAIKGPAQNTGASKDALGRDIYSHENYTGSGIIDTKKIKGKGNVTFTSLQPGADVYLQYTYSYSYKKELITTDPETGEKIRSESTVTEEKDSDFTRLSLPTLDQVRIYDIHASWDEVFAAYDKGFKLDEVILTNTSSYSTKNKSFDNLILDTLSYVESIEFNFTEKYDRTYSVSVDVSGKSIESAKNTVKGKAPSITNEELPAKSDKEYEYTVRAKDHWGNIIPMSISSNGASDKQYTDFKGTIFTRKSQPLADIALEENKEDTAKLSVSIEDADNALISGKTLRFFIEDKDGQPFPMNGYYEISGKKYTLNDTNEIIVPGGCRSVSITLTGLYDPTNYTAYVYGSYDQQPTAKSGATEGRVPAKYNTELGRHEFKVTGLLKVGVDILDPFVYGVAGKLQINDPYRVLTEGVTMTVSRSIKGSGTQGQDEKGRNIYSAYDDAGKVVCEVDPSAGEVLIKKNFTYTQEFVLGEIEPGSTVYFQYKYTYTDDNSGENKIFYSDITEIKLPEYSQSLLLPAYIDVIHNDAAYDDTWGYENVQIRNDKTYDSSASFTVDNYKKNTVDHIDHITYSFKNLSTGKTVQDEIDSSSVGKIGRINGGTSYTGKYDLLDADSVYSYSVCAYDKYDNELPFKISEGSIVEKDYKSYVGKIYTRKTTPVINIREGNSTVENTILIVDASGCIDSFSGDEGLEFYITTTENEDKLDLHGKRNGAGFEKTKSLEWKVTGDEVKLDLDNLPTGTVLKAQVKGCYNVAPTVLPEGKTKNDFDVIVPEVIGTLTFSTKEEQGEKTIPGVEIGSFEKWMYALKTNVTVTDPSKIIEGKVNVVVYSGIEDKNVPQTESYMDSEGNTRYPHVDASGVSAWTGTEKIDNQSISKTTDVCFKNMKPGSTVYVQYAYKYSYVVDHVATDSETGKKINNPETKSATVLSDLIEQTIPAFNSNELSPIKLSWNDTGSGVFATSANSFTFSDVRAENTSDYKSTDTSFKNIKKDTLGHVSQIKIIAEKVGASAEELPVEATMSELFVEKIKREESDYNAPNGVLPYSNTEYRYKVKAYDRYNHEMPVKLYLNTSAEVTEGYLYTCKTVPTAIVKRGPLENEAVPFTITINDPDGALKSDKEVTFAFTDKDGNVKTISGSANDKAFSNLDRVVLDVSRSSNSVKVQDIQSNVDYAVLINGSYDPQPDARSTMTDAEGRLQPQDGAVLYKYSFKIIPSGDVEYKDPVVSIKDISPWAYAVGCRVEIDDPAARIQNGVKIAVYKTATRSEEGLVTKSTATVTRDFVLTGMEPGTDVYIGYEYTYKDKTGTSQNVYSNLTKVQLMEMSDITLYPIKAVWDEVFAGYEQQFELSGIKLSNTSGYDPSKTNDFENYKKNTLNFLSTVKLELVPYSQTDAEAQIMYLSNSALKNAKAESGGGNYVSPSGALKTNTRYKYSVTAYDVFGNEIPLKICVNKDEPEESDYKDYTKFEGTIFTRNKITANITESKNNIGELELKVVIKDADNALISDDIDKTIFRFLDSNNVPVVIKGKLDNDAIIDSDTLELPAKKAVSGEITYSISVDNATPSEIYHSEVTATYDPTPVQSKDIAGYPSLGNVRKVIGTTKTNVKGADNENVAPVVSFGEYCPWTYAVGGSVQIKDKDGVLNTGINVTAKDSSGNVLAKTIVYSSGEFALYPLEPGKKVFITYSYEYDLRTGKLTKDASGKYVNEVKHYTVNSPEATEVQLPQFCSEDVNQVRVSWDIEKAAYEDSFAMQEISFATPSEYQENPAAFSFNNFKKNTPIYVDHIEIELLKDGEEWGSSTPIVATMSESTLRRAVKLTSSYYAPKKLLEANNAYQYRTYAYDKYGNEMPFAVSDNEDGSFGGYIYTRKGAPKVGINIIENAIGDLRFKVSVDDSKYCSLVEDRDNNEGLVLTMKGTDLASPSQTTPLSMHGTMKKDDGEEVQYGTGEYYRADSLTLLSDNGESVFEYTIMDDNLELGYKYNISITGDYDPTPDALKGQYQLDIVSDVVLARSAFKASDGTFPEPGGDSGEGGSGGSGSEESSQTRLYVKPTVNIDKYTPWLYAIGSKSSITDPTSAMAGGISFTAYMGIEGLGKHESNEYGQEVYSCDDYNGTGIATRTVVASSCEFAMAGLTPGATYYLQYSYSINPLQVDIIREEGTDKKTVETTILPAESVKSDLVRVTLPTVSEVINDSEKYGQIYDVLFSYEDNFAAFEDTIGFKDVRLKNTSDYVEKPDKFSFENYKKNMLQHLNYLDVILTREGENGTKDYSISKLDADKAKVSGVDWKGVPSAIEDVLTSNSVYKYTINAKDSYGNVIPLSIEGNGNTPADYSTYEGTAYTRKASPKIDCKTVENKSGKIGLKFTLTDSDSALFGDEPIVIKIKDNADDVYVSMGGTLKKPDESTENVVGVSELILKSEGEYILTLTNLAFSHSYVAEVFADYDPQPSAKASDQDASRLPEVTDECIGTFQFTTAMMESGSFKFNVSIDDEYVTAGSAVIEYTMDKDSTQAVMDMVSEIRLIVRDNQSNDILKYTLSGDELKNTYPDPENEFYEIATKSEADPRIAVRGPWRTELDGEGPENIWDQLFVRQRAIEKTGVDGNPVTTYEYDSAATLILDLPDDLLDSASVYRLDVNMVVIQMGEEYGIKTSLNNSRFTTKKLTPTLEFDELFTAGDVLEFINPRVYDKDTALSGEIACYLYSGTSCIGKSGIDVTNKLDDKTHTNIHFDSLAEGAQYQFVVRAQYYNNYVSGGYPVAWEIQSWTITAGSKLNGKVELKDLKYQYAVNNKNQWLYYSSEEVQQFIESSAEGTLTGNDAWEKYRTAAFELPDDAGAIAVDTPLPDGTSNAYVGIIYYKEGTDGKLTEIRRHNSTKGDGVYAIPSDATHAGFYLDSAYSFAENGLDVSYYTDVKQITISDTDESDVTMGWRYSVANDPTREPYDSGSATNYCIYMVPVQPKEAYIMSYEAGASGGTIHWYDENKEYISKVDTTATGNYLIYVPDEAKYATFTWNYAKANIIDEARGPYRVASANGAGSEKYTAKYKVTVQDYGKYLVRESTDGTARVTLTVQKSDSYTQSEWKDYDTQSIELEDKGDEGWICDKVISQKGLDPDSYYSVTISVLFHGVNIDLDTQYFRTDSAYEIIHNFGEMQKVIRNPYGNFIVVDDFTYSSNISSSNFTLYGSIDFQGHTVTKNADVTTSMNVARQGSVKNLVISYADGYSGNCRPFVYENSGIMENIIVRTEGALTKTESGDMGLFVYQNLGTIRNFILELGDDLTWSRAGNNENMFLVYGNNKGTIENGYIYGVSKTDGKRARLIVGGPDWSGYTSQKNSYFLFGRNYGVLRNIYSIVDTDKYHTTLNSTYSIILEKQSGSSVENLYVVGDNNLIKSDDTTEVSTVENMFYYSDSTPYGTVDNVWRVTKVKYLSGTTGRVTYCEPNNLSDPLWQIARLGDDGEFFDIKDNISNGFYPRLILPQCMQKNQQYVALPESQLVMEPEYMGTDIVDYISDSSGYIKVTFRNPYNVNIENISIANLTTEIVSQSKNTETGYWDVVLRASVDEDAGNQYLSTYVVNNFTYSGMAIPTVVARESTGFEFYKPITSIDDWAAIKNHPGWNYRLKVDLDFENETSDSRIQLRTDSKGKNYTFTGKIDGRMDNDTGNWSIKNITLTNHNYPSVIYRTSKASITNINVENLSISGARGATDKNNGFIGIADYTDIDNVHMISPEVSGCGNVGSLAGSITNSVVTNCSLTSAVINDIKTDTATQLGGMTGNTKATQYFSNLVVGLELSADNCTNINGLGGMMSRADGCRIRDCYTTGIIKGASNYAGGLAGSFYKEINNDDSDISDYTSCWSNMTLDITGDYVGGVFGSDNTQGTGIFAIGDIYCRNTNVHRVIGKDSGLGKMKSAYSGQTVTDLEDGERDGADYLITGEDIAKWNVWADKIGMDSGWNLQEEISAGRYPKVYHYPEEYDANGARVLVENQPDLYLPGQAGGQYLEVSANECIYDPDGKVGQTKGLYQLKAYIEHPGLSAEDFEAQVNSGDFTITVDGMNCTDDYEVITPRAGEESNSITVNTTSYTAAWDMYRLRVKYTVNGMKYELMREVEYIDKNTGEAKECYWEIKDIYDWYQRVGAHGKNFENFRFVQQVSFVDPDSKENGFGQTELYGRTESDFRNLRINRLEGESVIGSEVPTCGIKNFRYTINADGDPWIVYLMTPLSNLIIENAQADLVNTELTTTRDRTSAIQFCYGIQNCTFKNIETVSQEQSKNNSAFIYQSYRPIDTIRADGIEYQGTLAGRYMSGLVLKATTVSNVTASGITIDLPNASDVGGLFYSTTGFNDVVLTDSNVTACNRAGIFGSTNNGKVNNVILGEEATTWSVNVSGDGAGGITYYTNYASSNVTVKNGTVNGNTGYVGGAFGYHYDDCKTTKGENLTVAGQGYVGGLCGYIYYHLTNSYIVDSSVSAKNLNSSDSAIGGLVGYIKMNIIGCTVRNTKVTGFNNVGGAIGYAEDRSHTFSQNYIAEDVAVSATSTGAANVGGFGGYVHTPLASDIACGAEITAAGDRAGGLFGTIIQKANNYTSIKRCYYNGKITANDYVGGVIGYNNNYVSYTAYSSAAGKNVTVNSVTWLTASGQGANSGNYKTRSVADSLLVSGTFNSNGTNVSSWFNNRYNTDPDTGEICGDNFRLYIWDQTCLNGTPVNTSELPIAEGKYISAEDYRNEAVYKKLGFGENFSYDQSKGVMVTYMPYVIYSGTVLKYSDYAAYSVDTSGKETGTVEAGIKLPDFGTNPDATVVYASGVDTVNIEVSQHVAHKTTPNTFPEGYEIVEYLQSSGTQYINTGLIMTDYFHFSAKFDNHLASSYISGAMMPKNSCVYNGLYCQGLEYNYNSAFSVGTGVREMVQSLSNGKLSITVNGDLIKELDIDTVIGSDLTNTYLLFKDWQRGAQPAKFYYFTAMNGADDTETMNLIAVRRTSDGIYGMYDTIGKKFYMNQGSGSFSGGDAIPTSEAKAILDKYNIPYSSDYYNGEEKGGNEEKFPEDYLIIDYIESTGTQYIDTGYIFTSESAQVEIDYALTGGINGKNIFGSCKTNDSTWFCCYGRTGSYYDMSIARSNAIANTRVTYDTSYGDKHKLIVETDNNKTYNLTYDNEIPKTGSYSGTIISGESMYIFSQPGTRLNRVPKGARVYSFKMRDNGELVRDLIPVIRRSDKKAGLYDVVERKFYTNSGTGTFNTGEILSTADAKEILEAKKIEYPSDYNNEEEYDDSEIYDSYQLVDYIQSSGTQYIDTGYNPTEFSKIYTKFESSKRELESTSYILGSSVNDSTADGYTIDIETMNDVKFRAYSPTLSSTGMTLEPGEIHEYTLQNGNLTIDDETISGQGTLSGTALNELYLFRQHMSTAGYISGKMYSVKIWEGKTLKMNLVPCIRRSDMAGGMLDMVNKRFYGNAGGGTFSYGAILDDASARKIYTDAGATLPDTFTNMGTGTDVKHPVNLGAADVTITYNDETNTYRTDDNGVLTFGYDFVNDITVNGVTWKAEDLRRTLSLANPNTLKETEDAKAAGTLDDLDKDVWYYIDPSDNKLHYGSEAKSAEDTSVFPEGYAILEYIQSNGKQYIDTGYAFTSEDAQVEIDYALTGGIYGKNIFGSCKTNDSTWFCCYGRTGSYYDMSIAGSNAIANTRVTYDTSYGDKHNLIVETDHNNTYKQIYDGETPKTGSYSGTIVSGQNMYIFSQPGTGLDRVPTGTRVYRFKMHSGGELVRDMIPVRRISDSEVGMYDLVTREFYQKVGTDSFIEGTLLSTADAKALLEEVGIVYDKDKYDNYNTVDESLLTGYTILDSVKSTGTQYIATGIACEFGTKFVFDFKCNSEFNYFCFGNNCGGNEVLGWYRNSQPMYLTGTKKMYTGDTLGRHKVIVNLVSGNSYIKVDEDFTLSSSGTKIGNNLDWILFGMNQYSTRTPLPETFYSFKAYQNDELVRNMIPVIRHYDNCVGMYDVVTNKFFENAGTGHFAAGRALSTAEAKALLIENGITPPDDYVNENGSTTSDGYTRLEYIEATGTQYIDTGIVPTTDYEIDATYTTLAGGTTGSLFGNQHSDVLLYTSNGKTPLLYVGGVQVLSLTTPFTYNTKYTINMAVEGNSISVTGDINGRINAEVPYAGKTILIFANHRPTSGVYDYGKWRCNGFKYSTGGNTVCDLIPVQRNSDLEIGMYDLVSGQFFGNSGTGDFKAGPELPNSTDGVVDLGEGIYPVNIWSRTTSTEVITEVLTTDGYIYPLIPTIHQPTDSDSTFSCEISLGTLGTPASGVQETVKPFWNTNIIVTDKLTQAQATTPLYVYHNFTKIGGSQTAEAVQNLIGARQYIVDDLSYTEAPTQNVIYDQIILHKEPQYDKRYTTDPETGEKTGKVEEYISGYTNYLAVLGTDGVLTTNITNSSVQKYSVEEINNFFTSKDPIIMERLSDGTIVVIDYVRSKKLNNTTSSSKTNFLNFALSKLKSVTTGLLGGEKTDSDDSGTTPANGLAVLGSSRFKVTTAASPVSSMTTATNGTAQNTGGTGTGNEALDLVSTGTGSGIDKESLLGLITGTAQDGTNTAITTGEETNGSSTTVGVSTDISNGTQTSSDGSSTSSGSSDGTSLNENGAVNSSDGMELGEDDEFSEDETEESGTVEDEATEETTVSYTLENDIALSSAVYIPGEGVVDMEGNLVADASDVSYVEGTGVYINNELAYEESLFNSDRGFAEMTGKLVADGSQAVSGKNCSQSVLLVRPGDTKKQLSAIFGSGIYMQDPISGEMAEYVLEDILNGKKTRVSDALAKKAARDSVAARESEFRMGTDLPNGYFGDEGEVEYEPLDIEYTPLAIKAGFNKLVEDDDNGGFMLIAAAAAFGILVMIAIYFGAIRKKDDNDKNDAA